MYIYLKKTKQLFRIFSNKMWWFGSIQFSYTPRSHSLTCQGRSVFCCVSLSDSLHVRWMDGWLAGQAFHSKYSEQSFDSSLLDMCVWG